MTWSPGSIIRIFASTFCIITVTVTSISRNMYLKMKAWIKREHMENMIRRKKHHKLFQLKSGRQYKGIIQWIRFWVISGRE
jgi:hypothetical protein